MFSTEVNIEDVVKGCVEVTRLIGTQTDYAQQVSLLEIKDGEARLPEGLMTMKCVAVTNAKTLEDSDNLMASCKFELYPVLANYDKFLRTTVKNKYSRNKHFKVMLNGNKIKCNFKEGVVALSYTSIFNENNEVQITDNQSWINAVIHHLAFQIANRLYITDKLSRDKLLTITDMRNHYISQAGCNSRMGNYLDRIASKNIGLSSVEDFFPENSFFSNLGNTFVIKFESDRYR
jgi:hypothetical protein